MSLPFVPKPRKSGHRSQPREPDGLHATPGSPLFRGVTRFFSSLGIGFTLSVILATLVMDRTWERAQVYRFATVAIMLIIPIAAVLGIRKYLKQQRAIARYLDRKKRANLQGVDARGPL